MSKEYMLSVVVALGGLVVLVIGGYVAVLVFSPPTTAPLKEQAPTTGLLPRPITATSSVNVQ